MAQVIRLDDYRSGVPVNRAYGPARFGAPWRVYELGTGAYLGMVARDCDDAISARRRAVSIFGVRYEDVYAVRDGNESRRA